MTPNLLLHGELKSGPSNGRTDEEVEISEEQIIGILKKQEAGVPVVKDERQSWLRSSPGVGNKRGRFFEESI